MLKLREKELVGEGQQGRIPLKKWKIPERMCNGQGKTKRELIRIVRSLTRKLPLTLQEKNPAGEHISARIPNV